MPTEPITIDTDALNESLRELGCISPIASRIIEDPETGRRVVICERFDADLDTVERRIFLPKPPDDERLPVFQSELADQTKPVVELTVRSVRRGWTIPALELSDEFLTAPPEMISRLSQRMRRTTENLALSVCQGVSAFADFSAAMRTTFSTLDEAFNAEAERLFRCYPHREEVSHNPALRRSREFGHRSRGMHDADFYNSQLGIPWREVVDEQARGIWYEVANSESLTVELTDEARGARLELWGGKMIFGPEGRFQLPDGRRCDVVFPSEATDAPNISTLQNCIGALFIGRRGERGTIEPGPRPERIAPPRDHVLLGTAADVAQEARRERDGTTRGMRETISRARRLLAPR